MNAFIEHHQPAIRLCLFGRRVKTVCLVPGWAEGQWAFGCPGTGSARGGYVSPAAPSGPVGHGGCVLGLMLMEPIERSASGNHYEPGRRGTPANEITVLDRHAARIAGFLIRFAGIDGVPEV